MPLQEKVNFFGGGPSSTIGRVDGTKISADDFRRKVKEQEDYEQNPNQFGKRDFGQIVEAVLNQEVSQILLNAELDKLGMRVGSKEINDIMFGNKSPDDIKRIGIDQQTGQYSSAQAIQQINEIKKEERRKIKQG